MMTWEEHLAACKKRALEHVDKGDLEEAVLSMALGIQEHPETRMNDFLLDTLVTAATFRWHSVGIREWIGGFR